MADAKQTDKEIKKAAGLLSRVGKRKELQLIGTSDLAGHGYNVLTIVRMNTAVTSKDRQYVIMEYYKSGSPAADKVSFVDKDTATAAIMTQLTNGVKIKYF